MFEGRPHVIEIVHGNRTAFFTVGSTQYTVNGQPIPMTGSGGQAVAPFIGDGTNGTTANTTYLPLRFIADALGFTLNVGNNSATITEVR